MSRFQGFLHRLRVLIRRERYAAEQAREIEFHLELDALARESADPAAKSTEARHAARRQFGNVTYYREETRRASLLGLTDRVGQDARYAARGIARSPGFAIMVMATLALGIGVNAGVFSLLSVLFLRAPTGVTAPGEVRRVIVQPMECHGQGQCFLFSAFRYDHYHAIVEADRGDVPVAMFTHPDSVDIESNHATFNASLSEISRSYFSTLGVKPEVGRFLTPDEDSVNTPTFVAIISDRLWRAHFGADRAVLGRQVAIARRPFTIVGVAPAEFRGTELDATDVWTPINTHRSTVGLPRAYLLPTINLLTRVQRPGDEARIVAIAANALRTVPVNGNHPTGTVSAMAASIVPASGAQQVKGELQVITRVAVVALLVLAIAVANVINLLLLRAASRQREIGVRIALGVSHARLVGQLVVEGLVLALTSGVAATLTAFWTTTGLRRVMLPNVHWTSAAIDVRLVAVLFLACVVIGIAVGLVPGIGALRPNLIDSLRGGARDARHGSRLRSALLVTQAALCVVLLVGTSLFLQSLRNVRGIDVGYDVTNVANIWVPVSGPAGNASLVAAVPDVIRRLAQHPEIRAIAYARGGAFGSFLIAGFALPDGGPIPRGPDNAGLSLNTVSNDFFNAAGLHVVRGRGFSPQDDPSSARVAVVSEMAARVIWPGEEPIGKCIIVGAPNSPCTTVVGIVSDAHRLSVVESNAMILYSPMSQWTGPLAIPSMLIVRAKDGALPRVIASVQGELRRALPNMDTPRVSRLADIVEQQVRPWRLGAVLFAAFGTLAFVVAGVGTYSVVAYGAAQRTRELGIRIALGAQRKQIVDLVVADGVRAMTIGVVIGGVVAAALGPLVQSLLFAVQARDASAFVAAATAVVLLGTIASLAPALRAARVDPLVAIRSD